MALHPGHMFILSMIIKTSFLLVVKMFAYCREFEYCLRTRKGQTTSYRKNQTCLCMYVHFLFLEVETILYIDIVYLFSPLVFFSFLLC